MDNNGYVKMYRSMMNKGYYTDSEYVHLWVHIIFKATYQDKEYFFNGGIHHLQPGQFITGRKSLSIETGIDENKVERILKTFKIEQQIEQQTFNKFRIISICNWSKYQDTEQQIEQQVNNKRTASEQQVNTNKKDKKEKKEKKKNIGDFLLPDDVDPITWKDFEEMRNKLKSPLTDRAKNEILLKLNIIGQDKNKVLAQSIMQGWKGVFELKDIGGNNGHKYSTNKPYAEKGNTGVEYNECVDISETQ